MKNLSLFKMVELPIIVLLVIVLQISCTQEPQLWKVQSEQLVITDYVKSVPEKYSEFETLLQNADLTDLLSIRGPFTLFIPTNDAMKAYYKQIGKNSLSNLSVAEQKELAYNHLISNQISTGDVQLGALRDTNALGDFLVTEFSGSDIIVNKHSKIIDRDILCANGICHAIDQVIAPLKSSIYDVVAADPAYKLFAEGLKVTGIKDTLQVIRFPFGKKSARTRFTVLAVPDTVFNRFGIHTIEELIAMFTKAPDSVTYLNNGFYRYMEYHCMAETYYLSSLNTQLYPILSYDNNISVEVSTDYKLNVIKKTGKYTGFIVPSSNIPAKNGALHTINGLLPVIQPDPTVFTFETTDYFDMKQGDYFGKYYIKWSDGQNTFAKVKWEGDYLQYYYKNHNTGDLMNWDCLNMNGFWWCEITTPKIMKGQYKITSNLWSGQMNYEVYVDDVKTADILITDPAKSTSWGEFDWKKTEEHKIKVVNTTWGMLFWDTVIFTPIK